MKLRFRRQKGIPVGKDGYVPLKDIVRRYQEIGDLKDSDSDNTVILPRMLTPEEIEQWWDDPSVCDIDGIDTRESDIYSVPLSIRGRKRKALKRIAVLADRKESDRIKKVLAESFTAEELEMMAEDRSLMVSVQPHLRDCTGFYLRRQEGVPVPEIVLEEGTTPDGIVHEAVHHLRVKDGRTVFPTRDGVLDDRYRRLSRQEKDRIVGREEKETVTETVARTRIDPVESGYYDHVPGQSSRSAYLHDQATVSGSKALKGKAAIRAAERNYDRTSISRAILSSNRKGRR
jgi:hypothetical protein